MTRSNYLFVRVISLSLIVACGAYHGKSEAAIELMVIDAATDTDLRLLRNGDNLDVSQLGSSLTLRAAPSVTGHESVVFILDGARYQTENLAPYAMAGGWPASEYNPWDLEFGTHTVAVKVYDGRSGTGDLIASRSVSFSLVGEELDPQGVSQGGGQADRQVASRSSQAGGQEIPCNLQQRIDQASPGAIIYGAGCVERSAVNLRKRITLKDLTIKGSDDWSGDFTAVNGNYRSSRAVPALDEPNTTDDSNNRQLCEAANDVMCREAEMVFVNGAYLRQVPDGRDPAPGEFAMDSQRRVILGSSPGSALVEVVVRQSGLQLLNRSAGAVLDHVVVTQVGSTVGQQGSGTGPAVENNGRALTINNSEVSWVHGSGIACGGGVPCKINGTEVHHAGAAGVISNRTPLVFNNNVIHHNCSSLPDVHYNETYTCSGIKIHGTSAGTRTVTNNEFYNNNHAGVWLDGGANNVSIINNRIHHNDVQGIHIEIASDVSIRDNVIYENGWIGTSSTALNSSAVYMHDSANIRISGNVMAWNRDGVAYIGGSRRGQNTGIEVSNNDIIAGASDPGKQLLSAWLLLGDNLGSNIAHDNRYYYGGQQDSSAKKKFQWDRAQYADLGSFNSTPGEENSFWLTAGEVSSILSANNIPRESH